MTQEIEREKHTLQVGGRSLEYFEAGTGSAIIVFTPQAQESSDLLQTGLSQSHRVVAIQPASDSVNQPPEDLARLFDQLGVAQCCLMGIATGARPALVAALKYPQRIEKLILVSPRQVADAGELLDLQALRTPTLILVGTGDNLGAIEGRLCRERIPSSHLSFVYETG
ncbi:MAG TPA: alpha/beta hydrolase, partial [Candidatus Binataceae bacterium]|nr:alpha/beta hydrolase [Candidatus Binataceae bacterium]